MRIMKPLRDIELAGIANDLQSLVGAQLQEVAQTESEFGLAFYHDRRMVWLWFDLDPRRPLVLRFDDDPPPAARLKAVKPALLFVRAHLVGRRLAGAAMNAALGRVLELTFHHQGGEACGLQARLFPHGANLTAFAGAKSVSLRKPKDAPAKPAARAPEVEAAKDARDWGRLRDEWLALKTGKTGEGESGAASGESAAERARKAFEKAVAKKSQALGKMRAELVSKADPVWRAAGEWAKAHGLEGASPEIASCFDRSESLAWNIERCFQKAKDNERKLAGAQARLRSLESELDELRRKGAVGFGVDARQRPQGGGAGPAASLLEASGARGRRFKLGADLEAYIGKSAADNLALLRRARPHDYWLHLRDYPGAHAILRRPKGRNVGDKELGEIGRWVVVQSLHKPESELAGGKYDLILAECRHVRPIKGDKLGRVHYQNDRLFVVRF